MLANLAVALMVAAQVIRPGVGTQGNDLKQIVIAYHGYHDTNNKGPAQADDLARFLDGKKLIDALKAGDYVFIYGVGIRDMKDGTSNTVLAYDKNVPTKGGYVAYADGSVKRLTADEFKKAILAKKP